MLLIPLIKLLLCAIGLSLNVCNVTLCPSLSVRSKLVHQNFPACGNVTASLNSSDAIYLVMFCLALEVRQLTTLLEK